MRRIFALALVLVACRAATPPAPATRPASGDPSTAVGAHGMVASDAPLASQAGVEIMKAGGNAVDAAVAVGFALAVVYPEAGNLGGGGFTLIRMADGRVAAIDYREVAPAAGTRNMFLDDSGRTTRKSVVGPLASGVPGSVAGLVAQQQRFGVLSLARVMAPAIRMAEQGFVVDSLLSSSLTKHAKLIGEFAGASVFLPGGQAPAAGATLRLPALAQTLRAIADSGAASFYSGSRGRAMAEDLRAAGGIITPEDLAGYKPEWREPLRSMYRGHTLVTMPPPSSGVTMIEALNILDGFDLPSVPGSAREAHVIASALQRAFVDRNALIADPAFVKVPVELLSSTSYAAKLRASIGTTATRTTTLTDALGAAERGQTTPYSVVDAAGNAVSTTTTINDLYGSGVYLPTIGIFMNDEMDDFAANPGKPNMFGLVQGEQNAIQPGKRMLSSMLPSIVLDRAGKPLLLIGGRGGPRIISAVMQSIMNVVDHNASLPDAIGAPRIHHQALPDTLWYEADVPTAVLDTLRAWGYGTRSVSAVASVNGILRTATGWVGYSDWRTGGRPAGY